MTKPAMLTVPAAALVLACLTLASAQLPANVGPTFTGTYQAPVPQGTVTVLLEARSDGLTGYLEGPGVYMTLEGWVEEDGVAVGVASSPQGQLGFEAIVEGDTLGIWFYEVANGAVVPGSEIEVLLTRVSTAAPPPPPAPAAGQQGGAGTKLIGPSTAGAPQSGSPVIAAGPYAQLTQDDAEAFIEALEFALAQVGYAYGLTPAERAQALQAVAQTFPALTQPDQVVLSQARSVWERVKANWAYATLAEQREFVVGVLVLAFGEQTVRQWAGTGGGGGGQCRTFEDCAAGYLDGNAALDTLNAQSCWAAAGCEGYDPSTGTFDYGSGY